MGVYHFVVIKRKKVLLYRVKKERGERGGNKKRRKKKSTTLRINKKKRHRKNKTQNKRGKRSKIRRCIYTAIIKCLHLILFLLSKKKMYHSQRDYLFFIYIISSTINIIYIFLHS